MNIDERDLITLSDSNTYIIAKKIMYNNVYYYCLVDINNDEIIKFLYENNDKLIEIEDQTEFEKVIMEMSKNIDLSDILDGLKEKMFDNN